MMFGISSILGFMGSAPEMGIAVVAGALGLTFSNLEKFKKFSGAGFSAEMIESVFEKSSESTNLENNKDIDLIKSALLRKKYKWRTLKGITKETGLTEQQVWSNLISMYQNGLVKIGNKTDGTMIWGATDKLKQEEGRV